MGGILIWGTTLIVALLFWVLRDMSLWGFMKRLHRIAGAAAVASLFSFVLWNHIPSSGRFMWTAFVFAGLALYGLLLWGFNALRPNEVDWLKARLRSRLG